MQTHHESGSPLLTLVQNFVAPVLSASGFRKSGMNWNRPCGDLVHVLSLQASRWNDIRQTSFTVNIGIWVEAVWRLCWNRVPPKLIHESDCFPRLRVGYLIAQGVVTKDVWWSIRSPADVDGVGVEVRSVLKERCIPFLDWVDSINAVSAIAADPELRKHPADMLSYAILRCLSGGREVALQMLNAFLSDTKTNAWRERARGIYERLDGREFR